MKTTNKVFMTVLVLIMICSFTGGYGNYATNVKNPKYNSIYFDPKDDEAKNAAGEALGRYASVEDAIEDLNIEVVQRYDWEDAVLWGVSRSDKSDLGIVTYKFDRKSGELYQKNEERNRVSVEYEYCDGFVHEYDFMMGIIFDCFTHYWYIPGTQDHGDIYYGIWIGDEIKNMSFKKGTFNYLPLNYKDKETYFWTYELDNSEELLCTVIRPSARHPEGYDCSLDDVKKLLGIKCKLTIDNRIIIYWLITFVFCALFVFAVRKTWLLNNAGGSIVARVLFWIISILLGIIVATLISYYLSNPRLFFGSEGINKYIEKFFGFKLPNAI